MLWLVCIIINLGHVLMLSLTGHALFSPFLFCILLMLFVSASYVGAANHGTISRGNNKSGLSNI